MNKPLMLSRFLVIAAAAAFAPQVALADVVPSGERSVGNATIEPAYDDTTGAVVYLLTPNRLAPLGSTNSINNVDPHSVAPLFLVVYPPSTPGTFDCMGAPGNCPDHGGVIAFVATALHPEVYGTVPADVPGHDHLVGVAHTGGDFNAPWHVYVELFTSTQAVHHITTLSDLQQAWAHGQIDATSSGLGVDTGITFLCSVVSQAAYMAGKPVQ